MLRTLARTDSLASAQRIRLFSSCAVIGCSMFRENLVSKQPVAIMLTRLRDLHIDHVKNDCHPFNTTKSMLKQLQRVCELTLDRISEYTIKTNVCLSKKVGSSERMSKH